MGLPVKLAVLIPLIIAVVLDIIAVATPYWFGNSTLHYGIWNCEYCKFSDYFSTAKGLHMFALIAGIVSLICYIVTEVTGFLELKVRRTLSSTLSLVAGAFILVADCYMASHSALYAAGLSMSLIAAFFFIFVGGHLCSSITLEN